MSSDPAISVNRLSKEYKLGLTGRTSSLATIFKERVLHPVRGRGRRRERFLALDDVSFDVAPGEVVGVIGKNGAGKSTLLKILSRITFPTSGYVDLVGRVGSLLEVGTGFHQELTGIENIYLNGSILGMTQTEIDARLEQIIAFAEVDKFLETPVKRYSSGMRVRLAFAVAAHLEPEILIIDEVLSVGDAGFQSKCIEKMRAIASEDGRTVLYVSHNLVSVEHLCPRSLLLTEGRLEFDGDTPETITRYLESFPHADRGVAHGVFDLAAVDRTGTNHDAVFRRLVVRPGGGPPFEQVRMFERLQIEIEVEGLGATQDPHLMVTIGSASHQCLMRMTSQMRGLEAAVPRDDRERIVLDIPSVPLTPGEYHIELQLRGNDRRGNIDWIRRAGAFTVVAADVHGTGFLYSHHDGPVAVPWDWELRPASVVDA
jgi:lipopolysaccharide transport system ATP-binding protein